MSYIYGVDILLCSGTMYYESLRVKLNSKLALIMFTLTTAGFLLIFLVNKYFKIIDAVFSKRIDILFLPQVSFFLLFLYRHLSNGHRNS